MYHQLISEQRSQIFALLQKKTARKEIADIVGISQSTLSHEIKRNSTPSGKYIWTKAHDMAMQRRKRTVTNSKLTLVEKSTNMLFMQKLPFGKQSKPLAKVVRKLLLPYKDKLKTITTDNGPEFAAHKDITKYLGVPMYFADPYCSWQKGAVENANKLIRQYIPKKDSFDNYTDKRIMSIQKKLNERPREKLNFSTPKCEFFKHVL